MLTEYMDLMQRVFEQFAGRKMPTQLRTQLTQLARVRHYEKDAVLLSMGEMPVEIFFICKGLCRSFYLDKEGNDVTRFFILEGDFCFTEIQILAEKSELCIETLEPCDGLMFQLKDLELLCHSDFLKDVYIQALMQNIRYKIKRERTFLLGTATGRYLDFQQRYPGLEKRIKQSHLASYLGVLPSSLSRIRRTLHGHEND